MWLGGLGIMLQSDRSLVLLLVRAQAWVVGSVPRWGRFKRQLISVSLTHQCFFPSLSPPLPFSL